MDNDSSKMDGRTGTCYLVLDNNLTHMSKRQLGRAISLAVPKAGAER